MPRPHAGREFNLALTSNPLEPRQDASKHERTNGCMRRLCYVAQPSAGYCNETPTSVSVDTTGLAIHDSTAEE